MRPPGACISVPLSFCSVTEPVRAGIGPGRCGGPNGRRFCVSRAIAGETAVCGSARDRAAGKSPMPFDPIVPAASSLSRHLRFPASFKVVFRAGRNESAGTPPPTNAARHARSELIVDCVVSRRSAVSSFPDDTYAWSLVPASRRLLTRTGKAGHGTGSCWHPVRIIRGRGRRARTVHFGSGRRIVLSSGFVDSEVLICVPHR